jgi:hypothetical protein
MAQRSTGGSRPGLERLRRNCLFAYLDFSAVNCNDRMKFLSENCWKPVGLGRIFKITWRVSLLLYYLLISGVTTCDNFTVGLCVETIINHLVSERNRTGSELIPKFRILLYRNNDTNLQNFIARFHKVPDTIVAKDPVESILLQDPSDSSTRPHSPSVKGNLNDISLS